MAANGQYQGITTTKRNRKILGGSFVTANTSAPTSPVGDGLAARTGVGTFTVTLPKKFSVSESVVATVDNAADDDKILCRSSYAPATGVLTFIVRDISGAAAADTTGLVVNWVAIMSDRST